MEKYIARFLKCKITEGRIFFQNGGEADWPVKTLCSELVKKGISNFKFLVEESKREGLCIKWLDQQPYHNTHLIIHNKFLGYYLLKKN